MEGGVKHLVETKLENQDRRVQSWLDTFEQQMNQQMGSGQIPDIAEVKFEVAEIKKMVDELYDRPFIPSPVVAEVELGIYVQNMLQILDPVEEPQDNRKKRKHRSSLKKDAIKKAKVDSLQSEQDRQARVQEMHIRAGSLRLTVIDIEGGSDADLPIDLHASALVIIGATMEDSLSTLDWMTNKDCGTRLVGRHDLIA